MSERFIPQLPPRPGYIEEEQGGERVHVPTAETQSREAQTAAIALATQLIQAVSGELSLSSARTVRRVLQIFAQSITDESAMLEVASVYPQWEPERRYPVGSILRHGMDAYGEDRLYIVQQEHTSQPDWQPDKTPALYKAAGFAGDGTPLWIQPLGAHDAYQEGDRVAHAEKTWVSTVSGNVWEPGVYGWEEVTV